MVMAAMAPAADAQSGPRPFGHPCTLESYGARFCPTPAPTSESDQRVPSWDRAPLDVDVTLPSSGAGPFPTIVMLHGYGQDKTVFETTTPPAGAPGDFFADHFNNAWFAQRGYAVVNMTVRGAGNSCGNPQSRQNTPACDDVTFELDDQRYDARDVQHLLGLLVDEGIADSRALGVTGPSGGSILSTELALLRDRIRLPDGRFARWVSPHGTPLDIAAAYPEWEIADTLDILAPNGRFLDFDPSTATSDATPLGNFKGSFPLGAAATAPVLMYNAPTAPFNVPRDVAVCEAGGPDNPVCAASGRDIAAYHQAIGMPVDSTPAPMLVESGWDDGTVNGASQALRLVDYLSSVAPRAKISLQLADVGHGITSNKAADIVALNEQATGFFDHYLKGASTPPPPAVTAYTSTCPVDAPSGGPFTASKWTALHPGAVRFGSSASQTVTGGGDATISTQIDPVIQPYAGTHCKTFQAADAPGTVVYTHPVTKGFTMLGLPTMRMHVSTLGVRSQLNARLWDVAPDGQQSFVSRGSYALTGATNETVTWQLFGGGHTFPAGHSIRLELLNSDVPYLRPPDGSPPVTVSDMQVELPARERPDGGEIGTPVLASPSGTGGTSGPGGSSGSGGSSVSGAAARSTHPFSVRIARQRIWSVIARGLLVRARCATACTVRYRIALSRRDARRAGLRARTIATASQTLLAGQGVARRLRLPKKARAALRRLRKTTLTISIRVKLASGARRSVTRRVRLR
jgi:predicted acyl esterase